MRSAGIERLARVGRDRLGDGECFEQPQKGNRQSTAQEPVHPFEINFRDVKRRQGGRDSSDDRDDRLAVWLGCRPTKIGGHGGGDDQRH